MYTQSVASIVYQYSLGAPWDASTAVYDTVSLNYSSIEATGRGLWFSENGTYLYVPGTTTNEVHQYRLTTPWDLSTAAYDGFSLDISGEDTGVTSITMSPDGTRLFMAGITNDKIYSYTLTNPWDLRSATYDDIDFDVLAVIARVKEVGFKPDGTRMYLLDELGQYLAQYTLTTPWDVSTALFDFVLHDLSAEDTAPIGFHLKPDGTAFYMMGLTTQDVYQYSLGSAWKVSTIKRYIQEIDFADIPANREDEFKRTILSIKPLHSWAGLIIKYV
jgi:sugar lactone lactonase YvrE